MGWMENLKMWDGNQRWREGGLIHLMYKLWGLSACKLFSQIQIIFDIIRSSQVQWSSKVDACKKDYCHYHFDNILLMLYCYGLAEVFGYWIAIRLDWVQYDTPWNKLKSLKKSLMLICHVLAITGYAIYVAAACMWWPWP